MEIRMSEIKNEQPKKTATKKRKRRERISPEDQLQQERVERYNKLVFMASKAINKEAKVVKSFECQKVVRKLKQDQSNTNLEQKLEHAKGFSLDLVVERCLQQMGVPNLDPKSKSDNDDDDGIKKETNSSETPQDKDLLSRMLLHKRLVSAMDTWNEKVTEYRRWIMLREERVNGIPEFMAVTAGSKKRKKQAKKEKEAKVSSGSGNDLFVTLSGPTEEENAVEGKFAHYGPGAGLEDEYAFVVKKNRMGQRQRKCKAMAKQAKKEGRAWDGSANWREKKTNPTTEEDSKAPNRNSRNGECKPMKMKAAEIASMGKEWKNEGKAHPSWAAKQTQKGGIVAFAGKKITFD